MAELKLLKAPQENVDLDTIEYPVYASKKIDGFRCLIKNKKLHTGSMREQPNKNLTEAFKPLLRRYSKVYDGELNSESLTFSELQSILMSFYRPLPNDLYLYLFDYMTWKQWTADGLPCWMPFQERIKGLKTAHHIPRVKIITQYLLSNRTELDQFIKAAQERGDEGVMLRSPDGIYKHGRATIKQAIIFKYKFWKDFDAKIISVHEMEGIKDGAKREIDPTGHKKPVHKKADKEGKGTFGYFIVHVERAGKPDPNLALRVGNWKGCTDEVRAEIWTDPKKFIGQWMRGKGMAVGEKDLPRIPKDIEFRDSKD